MIGSNLEAYTFDNLLKLALSEVPDSMDKRQGSIIYDALAPACARLAEFFMNMRNVYIDTYVPTATGELLNYKVGEQGLTRYPATYALKKATLTDTSGNPMLISLGSRFSTISDIGPIVYYAESQYTENGVPVPGAYNLRCEVGGTEGNAYSGQLTNITYIKGLASAVMTDLIEPARNEETDEELRARYLDTINNKAYGGNIAQYNQVVKSFSGVGDAQIYPVWNGGGTVKVSVVDTEFNPCSTDFINNIKQQLDPAESSGRGIGIAPIGHSVTVVTPTELTVNVSMKIVVSPGYTLTQVTPLIKKALSDYFLSVKKEWGIETPTGEYFVAIYIARIVMHTLEVTGVANAYDITLNGSSKDLILTESNTLQQLPKLGEVTVNV